MVEYKDYRPIRAKPKPKQELVFKFNTSKKEVVDLAKSSLIIAVAFTIASVGFRNLFSGAGLAMFLFAVIAVATGFVFHEMGHKIVAQKYGCFAEFRSFDQMLLLALLMSFTGFLFIAPGAVFISGNVDRKKNGKISLAGPSVNIIMASVFLLAFLFLPIKNTFLYYGFVINSWLAAFNLIPLGNFDGAKVLRWSKGVYALAVGVAGSFFALQFFLPLV